MRQCAFFLAIVGLAAGSASAQVRVAVYSGTGTSSTWSDPVVRSLTEVSGFAVERIYPSQIAGGALSRYRVLVIPGGAASTISNALGATGRDAVRRFIANGGGYIGHCAGSYLAGKSSIYYTGLGIHDSYVVDIRNWARGTGTLQIRLTSAGQSMLGATGTAYSIYYANGPCLARAGDAAIPDYTTLATYASNWGGTMVGTAAITSGRYGNGRVVTFGPHPELTAGLHGWVRAAARWAAGGGAASGPTPIRPAETIRVRSGPGTGYAQIGLVPAGHIYAAASSANGWYRIFWNGGYGYTASSWYSALRGIPAARATADGVFVRSGPGTGYAILGKIYNGQAHVLTQTAVVNGMWRKIYWGGRIAYVTTYYTAAVTIGS